MNSVEQVDRLLDYGTGFALHPVPPRDQFVTFRRSTMVTSDADAPLEAAPQPEPKRRKPSRALAIEPVGLSIEEGAQYLGITSDQMRAFIADGELDYINVGRGKKRPRMRFTKADLD